MFFTFPAFLCVLVIPTMENSLTSCGMHESRGTLRAHPCSWTPPGKPHRSATRRETWTERVCISWFTYSSDIICIVILFFRSSQCFVTAKPRLGFSFTSVFPKYFSYEQRLSRELYLLTPSRLNFFPAPFRTTCEETKIWAALNDFIFEIHKRKNKTHLIVSVLFPCALSPQAVDEYSMFQDKVMSAQTDTNYCTTNANLIYSSLDSWLKNG